MYVYRCIDVCICVYGERERERARHVLAHSRPHTHNHAGMRDVYLKDARGAALGINTMADKINLADRDYLESLVARCPLDIGRKIEYFISTGNLVSQTGLDLSQVLCVMCVCVYVCVCVRMYVCIYLSLYLSLCLSIYVYTYIHMYRYIDLSQVLCVCIHAFV